MQFFARFAPWLLLVPLGIAGSLPSAGGPSLTGWSAMGSRATPAQQAAPSSDDRAHFADAPLLAERERGLGVVRAGEAAFTNHLDQLDDRRATLLVNGAPVPPGLSTARAKERRAQRDTALASLTTELGAGMLQLLDAVLSDPNAAPSQWEAAASVVGDLGLTRLAPRLAGELDSIGTSLRRAPARRALYALYGLWFETTAEVGPLLSMVEGPALTAYRDQVRALEERLINQLPRLWATETEGALAALSDRSPKLRAAAARALSTAVGAGRIDPVTVADALLAQLTVEGDGAALNALLESLAPAMQGRTPTDERVVALRTLLAAGVRGAPSSHQHMLTRMLAALPWDPTSANVPEAAASGIRLAQLSLERVVDANPIDTDVVIGVLQSLRSLAQAHQSSEVDLGVSLSAPVLALLSRDGVARHVRIAAAAALADFAVPSDLSAIVESLRLASDPSEAVALLGTTVGLLQKFSTQDIAAADLTLRALVAALPKHIEAEDAELRRRALTLLAELGSRTSTKLDVSYLVPRLATEPLPDLRAKILELLQRHGGAAEFDRMLELGVLGSVAVGLPDGPRLVADLAGVMSAGDASRRLGAARALAHVDDPTVLENALERAIELSLSSLTEMGAGASSAERAEVVDWALELRALVGPLSAPRGFDVNGAPLAPRIERTTIDRLLDDILPESALDLTTRQRAEALLAADAGRSVESVDRAFHAAITTYLEDPALPSDELFDLRREFARYLVRIDARDLARAEFRAIATAPDHSGARWLGVAGLTEYLALLSVEQPVEPRRALERCAALVELIELPDWPSLAIAKRVADLTELLAAAQSSKDVGAMQHALDQLAGLGWPVDGTSESWSEFEGVGDALGPLIELRVALESYVRAHAVAESDSTSGTDTPAEEPVTEPPREQGPPASGG